MDHAAKFCHRHSLNGREAAAHYQGHTERHMSSAQLIRWRRTPEKSLFETSIHVSTSLRSVPTFFSKNQKNRSRLSSWKMTERTAPSKIKPFNLTK